MMTVMEGFVAAPAGGGGSRLIYLVPWNRGLKSSVLMVFLSIYQQYNEKHTKNIDMECCVGAPIHSHTTQRHTTQPHTTDGHPQQNLTQHNVTHNK